MAVASKKRVIVVGGGLAGLACTIKLAEALQPAIELAEQGIAVDWYLTLKAATMAKELSRYPTTKDVWLPGGFVARRAHGRLRVEPVQS